RRVLERNAVVPSAAIFRREVIASSGGFPPGFATEDWALVLRLASQHTFAFRREPMTRYLRHPGNISKNADRMIAGSARPRPGVRQTAPDLPAEDRAVVDRQLRHQLYGHAYAAFDRGDHAEARRRFAALFQACGPDAASVALAAASRLPVGLVRR